MSSLGTAAPVSAPRVVLVEDSALFRQGVAALLTAAGLEVVAELPDARPLPAVIEHVHPDVVILDIRMPPTHTDEGIRAALEVRATHPEVAVLVLSTYVEGSWAQSLFRNGSQGLGYLLKDRVDDVTALVEAIRRIRAGEAVVDPEVISRLLRATDQRSALERLTEREREVLSLMAEGMSTSGIGSRLYLSARTVEAHIAAIFHKLPLDDVDNTQNRRVLAVLAFLRDEASRPA